MAMPTIFMSRKCHQLKLHISWNTMSANVIEKFLIVISHVSFF